MARMGNVHAAHITVHFSLILNLRINWLIWFLVIIIIFRY